MTDPTPTDAAVTWSPTTAGVSDLMVGVITPEIAAQAGAMRRELMADANYAKAAVDGDVAKQEHLRDLYMISRGMTPASMQPENIGAVQERIDEREAVLAEARLDTLAQHIRMSPQMRFEFKRGLATQDQVDYARAEVQRMLKDKAFGARVLADDADAKDRWVRMVQIANARIAPPGCQWSSFDDQQQMEKS